LQHAKNIIATRVYHDYNIKKCATRGGRPATSPPRVAVVGPLPPNATAGGSDKQALPSATRRRAVASSMVLAALAARSARRGTDPKGEVSGGTLAERLRERAHCLDPRRQRLRGPVSRAPSPPPPPTETSSSTSHRLSTKYSTMVAPHCCRHRRRPHGCPTARRRDP
jgi:hypothetical protein